MFLVCCFDIFSILVTLQVNEDLKKELSSLKDISDQRSSNETSVSKQLEQLNTVSYCSNPILKCHNSLKHNLTVACN